MAAGYYKHKIVLDNRHKYVIDFKFTFIEMHVTEDHCHVCFGDISGAHN